MPEPAKHGYGGGVKLVDYAVHPSDFEETTEGFAISVMHQMHCVVSIPGYFKEFNSPCLGRAKTFTYTIP